MTRVFKVKPSCHGNPSIEAHDLTLDECALLRRIVTNRYTPSEDYQAMTAVGAFLQGYEEPSRWEPGWALVEFWTDDEAAIQRAVDHVNQEFAKHEAEPS